MKNRTLFALILALLVLQPGLVLSEQNNNAAVDSTSAPRTSQHGWLGVYLTPVSRSLAAQLSSLMPAGQGIMVERVEKNSPAETGGIQQYDILLDFNGQKLYSPNQLSRLVESTSIDSPATVQLIRNAQLQTIEVTISVRPYTPISRETYRSIPPRIPPMQRFSYPYQGKQPVPKAPLAWDSFESVNVKTLPGGRYHAEVSFNDRNNETKSFIFEGYKEDIVNQIRQQKDLPAAKRETLLDALGMKNNRFNTPFNRPFMQGNPFNDPFFQDGPFNNSFFQDPFFNGQPSFWGSPFFNPSVQPPPWRQNRR